MNPSWEFYQGFEEIIEKTPPPSIGEITRSNLNSMTPEEIFQVKEYFQTTFPKEFSDNHFSCLEVVRELLRTILFQLQDKDTVLVPGDSPYKLVKLINLLFDLPKVRFIVFPLSGLGYASAADEVKKYLVEVFKKNGIFSLPKQLKILDYSYSGQGYMIMVDLLREINKSPKLQIPLINTKIKHDSFCHSLIDELFANAEHLRSRCVSGYFFDDGLELDPLDYISQVRCDVVIIILALYLQRRL